MKQIWFNISELNLSIESVTRALTQSSLSTLFRHARRLKFLLFHFHEQQRYLFIDRHFLLTSRTVNPECSEAGGQSLELWKSWPQRCLECRISIQGFRIKLLKKRAHATKCHPRDMHLHIEGVIDIPIHSCNLYWKPHRKDALIFRFIHRS